MLCQDHKLVVIVIVFYAIRVAKFTMVNVNVPLMRVESNV